MSSFSEKGLLGELEQLVITFLSSVPAARRAARLDATQVLKNKDLH